MAKLFRNMLLLVKTETTAGVDASPTAGANAILAKGIAPQPVVSNPEDRNLITPYFGHTGQVQVSTYSTIEFEVELAGSGAAGTAPKWGPLLLSSGFAETVTSGTKVEYAPITTVQKTSTIHCYLDGIKHVMLGCKGSVAFTLNAGGIPVMRFSYTGFAQPVTDASNPTGADFSGFIAPLAVTKNNSPTFTLHGTAVKAKEFSIDMANDIAYRDYIGAQDVAFTDRKPTGNAMFEYDAMATKNWWTIAANGTLGALAMTHGTTAGNIVEFAAPKVGLTNASVSNDGGFAMLTTGLFLQPDAGNDELVITVK